MITTDENGSARLESRAQLDGALKWTADIPNFEGGFLAADSHGVYVSNTVANKNTVIRYGEDGTVKSSLTITGDDVVGGVFIVGIAAADDGIYIAERISGNLYLYKFDYSFIPLWTVQISGEGQCQLRATKNGVIVSSTSDQSLFVDSYSNDGDVVLSKRWWSVGDAYPFPGSLATEDTSVYVNFMITDMINPPTYIVIKIDILTGDQVWSKSSCTAAGDVAASSEGVVQSQLNFGAETPELSSVTLYELNAQTGDVNEQILNLPVFDLTYGYKMTMSGSHVFYAGGSIIGLQTIQK
jgi:hypothetical protein